MAFGPGVALVGALAQARGRAPDLCFVGSPRKRAPPTKRSSGAREPARAPVAVPNGTEEAMNDRELTQPSKPGRNAHTRIADFEPADHATAELLSDILAFAVPTAHRLLVRLGGIRALCAAEESELRAAGIHATKARRLRKSIALAKAAMGALSASRRPHPQRARSAE